MGMVPNLVTGVWVGGEDRSIHFEEIGFGQGATMALPIWGLFMKSVYENEELGISQDAFLEPEILTIPLDCEALAEEQLLQTTTGEEDLDDLGF